MVHFFVHTIHSSEGRVVWVVSAIILHPNDCHLFQYMFLIKDIYICSEFMKFGYHLLGVNISDVFL